ncbi:MAG: hypothetical protein WCJ33_09765 [Pseudomonadota bacterium]
MTLNVSLPEEFESLVINEVKSGMFVNATDVVSEALRNFFSNNVELSQQEAAILKSEIENIHKKIANGEEHWVDGEKFFADLELKYS